MTEKRLHAAGVATLAVERFASPAEFLSAAEGSLSVAEVENALILGVARDLASGRRAGVSEPYFACVREGKELRMCAFRSLPDKAGITRANDPAVLGLLADDLREACPGIREIVGPEPTVGAFAEILSRLQGRGAELVRKSRIHVLRMVNPVTPSAAGRLRPGRESDLGLVSRWLQEFLMEIGEEGIPGDIGERWLREGKIYLWEADSPVSVAAATGKTA